MNKYLHIISFDQPFPPNYGGVIDVFYKLKSLHKAGVKIILHVYEYGRAKNDTLNDYCEQIYYYKRNTGISGFSFLRPYIVNSRKDRELLDNLLKDDYPILFEGLHTCYFLNHVKLQNRKKIVRTHNIEHEYYNALAIQETHLFKKIYFQIESKLLQHFESILSYANVIMSISEKDEKYFLAKFLQQEVLYLPAFHNVEKISNKEGKGLYHLFFANLAILDNELAALKCIDYFRNEKFLPLKIAGLKPSENLKNSCIENNITLIENPNDTLLKELIENAQVILLDANAASGVKLKSVQSVFQGRFLLASQNMVLENAQKEFTIFKDENDFKTKLSLLEQKTLTVDDILQREKLFTFWDNDENIKKLVAYL